jgi:hypothetical protein
MVDFSLVAVSAPKSSDHTDYSNLQFYGVYQVLIIFRQIKNKNT